MSKKKTIIQARANTPNQRERISYFKQNWLLFLTICFLTLGVLGSGLKYLEEDALRQRRADDGGPRAANEQSFLNIINPFLTAPSPATPQLAKEYIYGGGRLLAVEDRDAVAAPPSDLAVWRPATGTWWVLGGQGSQQVAFQWGMNGDEPAPGDYDGDGKTDFAIFRHLTSQWWIFKSSDNTYYSINYGAAGDRIAQADYDGDGKSDAAVFRPSTATFYILQSATNQPSQQQFGVSSDTPAPADYDGDGKADIGVWRGSNTTFYSLKSSDRQVAAASFGASGDKPVSADYDGDGRADYALFRDSNATWYIRKSGSGNALRQEAWGAAGDIPVPAYYRR